MEGKKKNSYLIDDPPTTDKPKFKNWKKDNYAVHNWLGGIVWNLKLHKIICFFPQAKEVWEVVYDQYSQQQNVPKKNY